MFNPAVLPQINHGGRGSRVFREVVTPTILRLVMAARRVPSVGFVGCRVTRKQCACNRRRKLSVLQEEPSVRVSKELHACHPRRLVVGYRVLHRQQHRRRACLRCSVHMGVCHIPLHRCWVARVHPRPLRPNVFSVSMGRAAGLAAPVAVGGSSGALHRALPRPT
jgi:hypothetical protein